MTEDGWKRCRGGRAKIVSVELADVYNVAECRRCGWRFITVTDHPHIATHWTRDRGAIVVFQRPGGTRWPGGT